LSAYADTSFLFSLYVSDSNSRHALSSLGTAALPWLATPFSEFELENAIYAFQFRLELTSADSKASIGAFRRDVADAVFSIRPFDLEILRRASLISTRRTPSIGCRALDVLHVACATVLGANDFYTFDERQARLARAEGLNVQGI
jgi:predicted nucleic acid-binding protein